MKENKFKPEDNLESLINDIKTLNFDINVTPYMSTELFGGQINAQVKIRLMDLIVDKWYKGFCAEFGYKASF